jgi:hypothetical protein
VRHDVDRRGGLTVEADGAREELRLAREGEPPRVMARGRFRHPQLSPDLGWVVAESWERGSWEVRAFGLQGGDVRLLAGGPSNELEPRWTAAGDAVLFASDLRRGLGSTAIYRVALPR